ncbi:MAG: hypothetical protein U0T73_12705 [Chitinophagales bacterium]
MNTVKRLSGFLWMLMGPAAIGFLMMQAMRKLSLPTATTNDYLQWSIIILIFLPIAAGLVIFGYFSTKGEYDFD